MSSPGGSDWIFFSNPTVLFFLAKKILKKSKKIRKNSEFFFKKIPKIYVFFPYKYLTILSTFNTKSSYNFFSIQYFLLSTHIIHFPHQNIFNCHFNQFNVTFFCIFYFFLLHNVYFIFAFPNWLYLFT